MDEHRPSQAFENARVERANLRRSIGTLEAALASPASLRTGDWAAHVSAAVRELQRSVESHIETTERPDGILAEIVRISPRHTNAVERLRADHGEFRRTIDDELARLEAAAAPPPDSDWVAERRDTLTELLARLVRHRQRGADLTFEAYEVDIGGES